ncbi:carboxypeptidase-like regulatory domain-containing protein [Chitinophagaceae bacterium LB-8]|uniref:Carboxypeptidase-like regulatory domain-containing protein n=1 Tax=Paraflavisolibacter caeni TaxID=2982496 RepID=A0A9X3BGF6_9BACT|nr:carboxypeptidase-like regulatory domain-containing protein [Paraflavisolibacter caeni]MCU7547672.1 carboxypeptidase-like regulatory domain-containing protein [Paraflavisolibacter caeni]
MKNIILHRTCLFLFVTLISFLGHTQAIISGKVVDSETKTPLEGASVFAQNTTRGVITNKEGDYRIILNKGGYELVISFTGYSSQTINIQADADKQIDIELKKEDKSMSEVVITSSNEVPDGLEKYGQFFLKNFIGATPFADSCTLKNPEALKFLYYRRSDRLKVLATEPLLIANNALGYNLRYELDSFVFYNKNSICSYRGNCLYTVMEGDTAQQALWAKNRQQTYLGSRLHFLRSYYDSTLKQDGFTVDMLSRTDAHQFQRLANPYDTSYYYYNDSTGNAELWFPQKASITYTKKAPEAAYLQQSHLPLNVKMQISYVDLSDAILIKENGYFLDQRSWTAQGYWSWKNLADQLPYDYEP